MSKPTLGASVSNRHDLNFQPQDPAHARQTDPVDTNQTDPVDTNQTDPVDMNQKDPVTIRQQGLADIRQREKDEILAAVVPGHIIQVCGPPMSGKSTLVQQAIDGSKFGFLRHDFMCEMQSRLSDVMRLIAESPDAQPAAASSVNEEQTFSILATRLMNFPSAHHVLVFHKCHSLWRKASEAETSETAFLNYLRRMADHLSEKFTVSIVLTSSKKLHMKGRNTSTIEIDMLHYWDVTSILQHYAPNVNVVPYVNICLNMLPLPGAVSLFAVKYLADDLHKQPPIVLERQILKDENFWAQLFERKVDSVEKWMPQNVLASMVHFCQFFGSSFYEAHLECTVAGNSKRKWQKLIRYLRGNYIVWPLPGTNRLVVHPLLVYYLNKSRRQNKLVLQGQWYDRSCNRYTHFLCRLLRRTEMNMEKLGNSGLVYGCLALEWPHIRHMIEMAINCNENTYKMFLKAAISGRALILRCFSEEAHDMYSALLDCAKKYGTLSEQGVIEALLGHCKGFTAILSKGGTWLEAENCLDSAIEKLRINGPSFALMWAISRKAILLTRQGKYKESLMCFKAARRVTVVEADDRDLREAFGVSKLQVKEEKITRDIYHSNALIFLGENDLAQDLLLDCYQDMQNEFSDHPELATAINSLGLIEERGHQDKEKALEWYLESYKIRLRLAKFSREILVVSLNNIGMIYLRLGKLAECKKYLTEALKIRRDLGWVHANTALTLTHMGVLNFKCCDFHAAYQNTLEADEILEKILPNHDTRLRINNALGHLRQLLEIQRQQVSHNNAGSESQRSPKEYFANSLEVASRITGNHSDDGYHHFFLAHEHIMMLALGNSEEEYNRHKEIILPYFEVSETVGRIVFEANEKISNHMDLYNYFSATDYEAVDKRIFISHLVKACEFCQNPFCAAEKMWCDDEHVITDSEDNRELPMHQASENELTGPLANISEQEDNMPDNHSDTEMKTADSDLSNGACMHEDQRSLPASADFNFTSAVAKSQEDLENYKLQYLSTFSDIPEQKSSSPSPAGELNLHHNENVTPSEVSTNDNSFSGKQKLIPVNSDSPLDNSSDNGRPTVMFSAPGYSNANTLKLDSKYQSRDENRFSPNHILSENASINDYLENSNEIIEYTDDDDYDDVDDYDDDYEITSEAPCDVNESSQYSYTLSVRSGQSHVDNVDYSQAHDLPLKTDNIRNEQSSKLSDLNNPELSHDMKDAFNQNYEPEMPATSVFQDSPAYGKSYMNLDNKQYQTSSK